MQQNPSEISEKNSEREKIVVGSKETTRVGGKPSKTNFESTSSLVGNDYSLNSISRKTS